VWIDLAENVQFDRSAFPANRCLNSCRDVCLKAWLKNARCAMALPARCGRDGDVWAAIFDELEPDRR
jgi:hypothetical protein